MYPMLNVTRTADALTSLARYRCEFCSAILEHSADAVAQRRGERGEIRKRHWRTIRSLGEMKQKDYGSPLDLIDF